MKPLLLLLTSIPLTGTGQTVPFRHYKKNETFSYRLTTDVYRNDKLASHSVAVSYHTVIKEKKLPAEQIRWISKSSVREKDTVSLDSLAQNVNPYIISLSPKSKVLLPKLSVPDMTGEITDLNTFYVAIAPALNAQKLSATTSFIMNKELRRGNFADSAELLYGTDCLQVSQKLVSTGDEFVIVETAFTPPASFCLEPLLDTVSKKTFADYNNIEFIRKNGKDKVNLFWGTETFVITSKIDRQSGKIIEATMHNTLTLRLRYDAAPNLSSYAIEMPITIKRNLKLELVK